VFEKVVAFRAPCGCVFAKWQAEAGQPGEEVPIRV
jgi:hypothetical protein